MRGYKYIEGVTTLQVDWQRCICCGNCTVVCPHRLFSLATGRLEVADFESCMECGACARNCPVQAITVNPGAGCAAAILAAWVHRLLGGRFFPGCC